MYLFIEKILRGGIYDIAKRYTKANKKHMKVYDSKKPSKFITYLDMNSFYCQGLSENLPYSGFKWLKKFDGFNVNSISEKSPIGYFLEVDPKCPNELNELHNDYPLAPEKLAVSGDMLSKYC